jgi:hypothetical protein
VASKAARQSYAALKRVAGLVVFLAKGMLTMAHGLLLELEKAEFDCLENAAKGRLRASLEAVELIEQRTGGEVILNFLAGPGLKIENDPDGNYHRFVGALSSEEDYLYMDDRKPEPLVDQMASELRRLAAHCERLAERIERYASESKKERRP